MTPLCPHCHRPDCPWLDAWLSAWLRERTLHRPGRWPTVDVCSQSRDVDASIEAGSGDDSAQSEGYTSTTDAARLTDANQSEGDAP